jgi:NAD-dependent dihydropyrimidine dehydrogenase PreA subunit
MRVEGKGPNRKIENKNNRGGKHGHHKSREGRHGHLRSVERDHEHHGKHRHSKENPIEFLKNEALILEKKLTSIKQRIKDMEEGKIPSELKAIINQELCIGCGKCENACKHGAITIDEVAVVDRELCVGCGHCIDRCREGAITL